MRSRSLCTPLGVNFFSPPIPDLLHRFDLGVWKAFFAHLIRLLNSVGSWAIGERDGRYRKVDPFGRLTARKVDTNASEMKKLAARDFEDLLLVCLDCPSFRTEYLIRSLPVTHARL